MQKDGEKNMGGNKGETLGRQKERESGLAVI
jgi:hypothetical protein